MLLWGLRGDCESLIRTDRPALARLFASQCVRAEEGGRVAERREEPSIHTDRPGAHESSPTVREIIGLDAVAAGHPQLLAGESGLDARVRWVHVSDSAGVARLLDGGELLLSTGSGWPEHPDELRAFVDGLVTAGLACLVVELGTHYRYMPAVLIDAARAGGLPLVALHREVKFVTITEAVHRRIIAEQTAALRARDDVRARFTALALRGSPADFIVHQLAQTLGAAVVLENLAHEVVVADVAPSAEEEVLTRWEVRSRIAHRDGAASAEGWLIVPVEARGIRWGYLVALPGPPHPAGRAGVLEQGAIALALGRLTDTEGDEWALIGRRRLLDELLAGRWSTAGGATARVEAAGMPVDGARLYGLVASGVDVRPETADAAAGRVQVAVTVTNVGAVAGTEVVQVYVGDPDAEVHRPPRELRGFEKVRLVPGASTRVEFRLDSRDFAYWDAATARADR